MMGIKLVRAVMAEYRLGEVDFFTSRFQEHLKARVDCIKRLSKAGVNKRAIARVMRRDRSTIIYWLSPDQQERKKSRMVANRKRATELRVAA